MDDDHYRKLDSIEGILFFGGLILFICCVRLCMQVQDTNERLDESIKILKDIREKKP